MTDTPEGRLSDAVNRRATTDASEFVADQLWLSVVVVSYQPLKRLACQWDSRVSRSRFESPTPLAF